MDFAFPAGLWAFLALVPFILLYLIRPRPKQMGIPSLMFFMKHEGANKVTSLFRTFVKDWLFLLQLLLLILLAFAAARPFTEYSQDVTAENIVFVMDASASMHTKEGTTTRFQIAKEKAKGLVGARNTVILAKEVPLIGIKNEKSLTTQEYIQSLSPTDTPTRLGDAILLAGETLSKGRVVVVSDFVNTGGQDPVTARSVVEAKGIAVDFINVAGLDKTNMGIVDVTFGESVTAIIANTGSTEQTRTLRAGTTAKEITLAPGESDVFSFAEPQGVLKLELEGSDDFKVDDVAYVAGSATQNVSVLLITNNQSVFLTAALKATGLVSLQIAEPPIVPKERFDVYILHNIDKNEILSGTLEIITQHVKDGSVVITHAQKDSHLFDYKGLNPVKIDGFKDKAKVVVQQLSTFTKDIDFGVIESVPNAITDGDVYASAAGTPVLASKPLGAGTIFYFGFIEEAANFKFTPDYPIFWNGLISFLSGHQEAKRLNYKTGQQLFVGKRSLIVTPAGPLEAASVPLELIGTYTVSGKSYGVSLLNEIESTINAGASVGQKSTEYELHTVTETKKYDLDLALLSLALVLVLLEVLFIKMRGDL
ncbi:MAG: BatA and WFA domain-containing protein [Candidatus Woesearchaeota archaeon]|jgi:hypothetical protein|nr:BatA and WFA domain-containing protein [Candidatus Woesearchaeota archaeon]MDP7181410.1 BatA and WFA domain-containing protein [Candidatus Woesearchaeota archaeon]MDP7198452.1 BatA and WFA domain-containing protein [Candidatus Woesearchaeota archaeon]MDP7466806.1 BatA and WFA domain-containing protein [Candidatus Woesearchaeota archaeon]MDP7648031.1 BatA and WFA domain-containing protein [Candidatus Woesearchaeota archaeon]